MGHKKNFFGAHVSSVTLSKKDSKKKIRMSKLDQLWEQFSEEEKGSLLDELNGISSFTLERLHELSPEAKEYCPTNASMNVMDCKEWLIERVEPNIFYPLMDKIYHSLSNQEKKETLERFRKRKEALEEIKAYVLREKKRRDEKKRLKKDMPTYTLERFEELLRESKNTKEKKRFNQEYRKFLKNTKPPQKSLLEYKCVRQIPPQEKQDVYRTMVHRVNEGLLLSILKEAAKDTGCFAGTVTYLANPFQEVIDDVYLMKNTVNLNKCQTKPIVIINLQWIQSPDFDQEVIKKLSPKERERYIETVPHSTVEGHALAMIIDRKLKTIEAYDPLGELDFVSGFAALATYQDVIIKQDEKLMEYKPIDSHITCPIPGMQKTLSIPRCANFTFLYVLSRILLPTLSTEKILERLNSQSEKELEEVLDHLLCMEYDYARYYGYLAADYLLGFQRQSKGSLTPEIEQGYDLLRDGHPDKVLELFDPFKENKTRTAPAKTSQAKKTRGTFAPWKTQQVKGRKSK